MTSRSVLAALVPPVLLAVACGSSGNQGDGGTGGAQCVGACCPGFQAPTVGVNPDTACKLIQDSRGQGLTIEDCTRLCGGDAGFEDSYQCFLPQNYVQQVLEMNGLPGDGGALDGGALVCIVGAYVTCSPLCVGEA